MKHVRVVCVFALLGMLGIGQVMAETSQEIGQPGSNPGTQQDFDTIKQRIEQRIQDGIAKMQEKLSCVQNAQDPQTLRSCLPNRGGRRRGGFGAGQ
jgi:hypothetical protein